MKIQINSVHFKADQKLEDFINRKVSKLGKMYNNVIGSDITLKVDKNESHENKIAEIRLAIPGYDLFAKKQSDSFEHATDTAVDALIKQLKKYKDKQK
jgi:ribosome hibernation promoting factor